MRRLLTGLALSAWLALSAGATPEQEAQLREQGLPPADYLLRQFQQADLVLLGEDHAVKQNLQLVAALIPRLHHAGVHQLVMEFGAEEDQAALDELVNAPTYNAARARALMFSYNTMWSWQEYRALYEAAWRLNLSLAPGEPRFRIVNMSYRFRWRGYPGYKTPETMRQVFWRGSIEKFRAELIDREVLARGGKALVLTGTTHAFTRYEQPVFDYNADGYCRFDALDLGNRLYRSHGARVRTVLLHQPFPNRIGAQPRWVQPAGGAVERLMAQRGSRPVGFDLRGTAMGQLPDDSHHAMCHPGLTLGELADGYVFLAPFAQLEAATPDPDFVTPANLQEALALYPPDLGNAPGPTDLATARQHLLNMARQIDETYRALR